MDRCSYDPSVYGRWLLVMHLIRGLDTLFAPSLAWKALCHTLRTALWPNPEHARASLTPLQKADPVTHAYVSRYLEAEVEKETSPQEGETQRQSGRGRRRGEETSTPRPGGVEA